MPGARQFVVLQKEAVAASPEQLKRAFSSFSNMTDADAVRLAIRAQGILVRQVNRDEARALQQALQAEGVGAAYISEEELPRLPEARVLHRLELSEKALITYDLLGRSVAIPWTDVALIAAGAVTDIEMSRTQTERTELRFNMVMGVWPKQVTESNRRLQVETQLVLEILLADGATRFKIEASRFPFNYVINEPELSTQEKFIWLVRELCRCSTEAVFNGGARWLRAGHQPVPGYNSRQALHDEMVWLLWRTTDKDKTAR